MDHRPLGPSGWLWKEGAGVYTESEADLIANPGLPNPRYLPHLRLMTLLHEEGGATPRCKVLEIGCGRSVWLPYLAGKGCCISGIEIEPYAARLARANLVGAKASGEIYCQDAFDIEQNETLRGQFDVVYSLGVIEHLEAVSDKLRLLSCYLKPGGRIVSLVPNLQGINWLIQRFASLPVLRAHVIYTTETLREVHEEAGYKTVVTKYLGFFDGFLTTSAGVSSLKRQAHYAMCRFLSLSTAVWTRAGLPTPEWRWTAPFVVYVGILPAPDRSFKEVAKNHAASMVAS